MRKKQGLRRDSSHTEMNSDNGIQRTRDLNYGTSSMAIRKWESISGSSR